MATKTSMHDLLDVTVQKTDANYKKPVGFKQKGELGVGRYSIRLSVTATNVALYIPASIGSGRVSTGIVYHIEGTEKGKGEAEIGARGEGVTTITAGSISYWKIPPGKTALIKVYIEVTGSRAGMYKVVVSRINFKLNPNDMRYTRFLTEIRSDALEFRR